MEKNKLIVVNANTLDAFRETRQDFGEFLDSLPPFVQAGNAQGSGYTHVFVFANREARDIALTVFKRYRESTGTTTPFFCKGEKVTAYMLQYLGKLRGDFSVLEKAGAA